MLNFSKTGPAADCARSINALLACPPAAWQDPEFLQKLENLGAAFETAWRSPAGDRLDLAFSSRASDPGAPAHCPRWTFLREIWPAGSDDGHCDTAYAKSEFPAHPGMAAARAGSASALAFLFSKGLPCKILIQGAWPSPLATAAAKCGCAGAFRLFAERSGPGELPAAASSWIAGSLRSLRFDQLDEIRPFPIGAEPLPWAEREVFPCSLTAFLMREEWLDPLRSPAMEDGLRRLLALLPKGKWTYETPDADGPFAERQARDHAECALQAGNLPALRILAESGWSLPACDRMCDLDLSGPEDSPARAEGLRNALAWALRRGFESEACLPCGPAAKSPKL